MTLTLRTASGRAVLIGALMSIAVLLLVAVRPWRASPESPQGLAESARSDPAQPAARALLPAQVARGGERAQERVASPARAVEPHASVRERSPQLDAHSLGELRGEAARMSALRAMAAQDREGFDALAAKLLTPEQPASLQVPVLRVLWALDPEQAAPLWLNAIRELPDEPRAGGVSVPAFVVRVLGERAPRSAPARACLSQALWHSSPALADERRVQAARSLAAATAAEDWPALRARLVVEPDETLRRAAGSAFASGAGGEGLILEDVLGELGL